MSWLLWGDKNFNQNLHNVTSSLIYPAFAGTLLYNFSKAVSSAGLSRSLLFEPWFWTGVWFIVYFCCSYAQFFTKDADRTTEKEEKEKFGPLAFVANLLEVLIILAASLVLDKNWKDSQSLLPGDLYSIYVCWFLIPISGSVSNYFSEHKVKWVISVFAMAVAGAAYCFPVFGNWYSLVLVFMSVLLIFYILILARKLDLADLSHERLMIKLGFKQDMPRRKARRA